MFCLKCGKQIPDEAEFCPYCGSNLLTEPAENAEKGEVASEEKTEIKPQAEKKKVKKPFSALFEIIADVVTAAVAALCGWFLAGFHPRFVCVIIFAAALVLSVVLKAVLRRRREKKALCLIVDCLSAVAHIAAVLYMFSLYFYVGLLPKWFVIAVAAFILVSCLIKLIIVSKPLKKLKKGVSVFLKILLSVVLAVALLFGESLFFRQFVIFYQTNPTYSGEAMVVYKDDFIVNEALKQYESGDHTNLKQPIEYNILWLGYENVYYEELLFTMNERDKEYLENTIVNFEHTVEQMSNNNIDVKIDFHFIEEKRELYSEDYEKWLYLEVTEAQQDIDQYNAGGKYDTVITTVQGEGEDNYRRREPLETKYPRDMYYIILGVQTVAVDYELGYSTFNLSEHLGEEIIAEDPSVPSLYSTALAVHEWLHQFEGFNNEIYSLFFPEVHCYMEGYTERGYREYIADENNYDFFELYEEILSGTVPYSPEGEDSRQVGMYPKMWWLAKKSAFSLGEFTIKSAQEDLYLAVDANNELTLREEPYNWEIKSLKDRKYEMASAENPQGCITLCEDGISVGFEKQTKGDSRVWYIMNCEDYYKIQKSVDSDMAIGFDTSAGITDRSAAETDWIITEA